MVVLAARVRRAIIAAAAVVRCAGTANNYRHFVRSPRSVAGTPGRGRFPLVNRHYSLEPLMACPHRYPPTAGAMTTTSKPRQLRPISLLIFAVLWVGSSAVGLSQSPPTHPLFSSRLPPGVIGAQRLSSGAMQPGYVQPVQILAPIGTLVAAAHDQGFGEAQPTPAVIGLQVGLSLPPPTRQYPVDGVSGAVPNRRVD